MEKEGRDRKEGSIKVHTPPPQPITFNQDLADYIEMFEAYPQQQFEDYPKRLGLGLGLGLGQIMRL